MSGDHAAAARGLGGTPVSPGDVLRAASARTYRVDSIVGEGVTGVVLSATCLSTGTKAAIKILRTALASVEIERRFQREGEALGRIASDHVVHVLDVGDLPDGGSFMVMEHLEGRDLARVLREDGPMSVEDAVDCMLQVCEALAAAHDASVVHRDLKPANLLMTRQEDGTPHVKVVDFGISKLLRPPRPEYDDDDDDDRGDDMTGVGNALGSPRYMAPEQLKSATDVDVRADLWSVGCVLYQLLTGRHPFAAPSTPESMVRILYDPPDALRATAPHVPEALEAVVLRALARSADDRWQSARDLAGALRPFGSGRRPSVSLATGRRGP